MAQAKTSAKARMVVHDGAYRVVVAKNPEPAHEHDVVHAYCIEQNLVGRGTDVAAALHDLAETVADSIAEEYESSHPGYQPNPDPELVDAYEHRTNEFEDCKVIRRGTLRIRIERMPPKNRRKAVLRPTEFTFSPEDVETSVAG